jgi:hypothetical protein
MSANSTHLPPIWTLLSAAKYCKLFHLCKCLLSSHLFLHICNITCQNRKNVWYMSLKLVFFETILTSQHDTFSSGIHCTMVTNSMKQNPSWETKSHSATKEILGLSQNPKVQCLFIRVHRCILFIIKSTWTEFICETSKSLKELHNSSKRFRKYCIP